MKHLCLLLIVAVSALLARAEERSFSIVFGAETPSSTSLKNDNFTSAVSSGKSYIKGVTSVVAVFPEADAIRLSSNKTNGKFNIALTDEASVAATRIEVKARRYDNQRDADAYIVLNGETIYIPEVTAADYSLSLPSASSRKLTNLIVDADRRVYIHSITVYYDSATGDVEPELETVATPVIVPGGGTVSYGTNVSMSCATEGAVIYYTIDGAEPTSAATVYSEPFAVFSDMSVKAFAVKEGMNPSEMAVANLKVRNSEASLTAEFDFANPASLNPSVEAPAQKEFVSLDGRTFTDGDVAVSFTAAGDGNHVRLYHSYDAGIDVRVYDGESVTVRSLNPNMTLLSAEFEMSLSGGSTGSSDVNFEASTGEYEWLTNTWTAQADESVSEVVLTSGMQSRFSALRVKLQRTMGIDGIENDHDERAAYYTLQGLRVSQPGTGIYIRVTPTKAEKVIIRP